jgi:hypothetical protein
VGSFFFARTFLGFRFRFTPGFMLSPRFAGSNFYQKCLKPFCPHCVFHASTEYTSDAGVRAQRHDSQRQQAAV